MAPDYGAVWLHASANTSCRHTYGIEACTPVTQYGCGRGAMDMQTVIPSTDGVNDEGLIISSCVHGALEMVSGR